MLNNILSSSTGSFRASVGNCAIVFYTLALVLSTTALTGCQQPELSERERQRLLSLGLHRLSAPIDNSNRFANDAQAQKLGEQFFFDKTLSSSKTASCATCHIPEKGFTDGLPRAAVLHNKDINFPALRNTPTVVGSAWATWQYWDGRRDSLWSQALTPLEAPAEMANNRVALVRQMLSDQNYRRQYEQIFGAANINENELRNNSSPMGNQDAKQDWYTLPKPTQTKINTAFANIGKAIAAYQSTLKPPATRFDEFVNALANGQSYSGILSNKEYAGARLFVNDKKTQCLECHNGPLLSNNDFHNVGSATFTGDNIDFGRALGVQAAMINEFNCHGRYSDAKPDQCMHLNFMNRTDIMHTQGGFKTPTLRNVANTAPYFHDGRFTTLEEVIAHYTTTPLSEQQTELREFPLSEKEIESLIAFLQSLSS